MSTLPKITSAMLVVTHACNLRCVYCFVNKKPEHMSYETALNAVKFLIENAESINKVPNINFFGGEPTLMWDSIIVPLTTWIRREYAKPFTIGITTNGTLLDDERMSFLLENHVSVLFSIDGDKVTQDYNRPYHNGEGSFDSLSSIIPKISKNFPYATFRSTAIPPTCQHVFDNIMFARDSGFKKFYVVPNVFEAWTEDQKAILKHELDKYVDYYIEEYRQGRAPIEFTSLDDTFKDINKINYSISHNQRRKLRQCSSCGKCGLGATSSASIDPNGNIYGCQEMTSNEGSHSIFYIGNIYDGVDDERRLALMKAFDDIEATGTNCSSCRYDRICNGGCVANNYMINGALGINPPMYCWWQQTVLDAAIRIVQTLGNEENVAFLEKWRGLQ